MFCIESRNTAHRLTSAWEALDNGNFDSEAEALAAIEELKLLGGDWAEGEYRVVEDESVHNV